MTENALWSPNFSITPSIARALMEIEAAKTTIEHTPISLAAEAELRRRARLRSTHYSTRIEGNRLTLAETEEVIQGSQGLAQFKGRERDVNEVQNYWNAHLQVEDWAGKRRPLSTELIQRLHALVEYGKRAKPTQFRDGQNAIRDSLTGALVYLPPEAQDVPSLMSAFVKWIAQAEKEKLPVPLIAALAHYQFVTIHPYYDGNGRTARLLATFILHRGGYGLNGFFSLEEFHARDLNAYYGALQVHPHHNYYFGRESAELTAWVEYFTILLARVFSAAREEALRTATPTAETQPSPVSRLDPRVRRILELFIHKDRVTSTDIASELGIADRSARELISRWVTQGILIKTSESNRNRAYELSAVYRQVIGKLSEVNPS